MQNLSVLMWVKWREFKQHLNDPLFKNSFWMGISRLLNASVGFLFWLVAARLYSKEAVGITSALFSYLDLVLIISVIGCDFALIRYLPVYDKKKVLNTCLTITVFSSIIIGSVFVLISTIFFSELSTVRTPVYVIVFLLFTIANMINYITGTAFIAARQSIKYFYQNLIRSIRIPFLIAFVFTGSLGIFQSLGIAYTLSSLFSLYLLNKTIGVNFKIDRNFIKKSFKFSLYNYFAHNLFEASLLIIPIMVLSMLGKVDAANYYIAVAIGDLVLIIPNVLGTSIFVEGSHGESIKRNFFKSLITTYMLLIPVVFLFYFYGYFFVGLFGKNYLDSFQLLSLISISSIFAAFNLLFISVLRVKMMINIILKINILLFFMLLGFSYIFILKYGLLGAGLARITAYGFIAVGILLNFRKNFDNAIQDEDDNTEG